MRSCACRSRASSPTSPTSSSRPTAANRSRFDADVADRRAFRAIAGAHRGEDVAAPDAARRQLPLRKSVRLRRPALHDRVSSNASSASRLERRPRKSVCAWCCSPITSRSRPEIVESMRRDLFDVISRYVEVDTSTSTSRFEQQDRTFAMLANIPISRVNASARTRRRDRPRKRRRSIEPPARCGAACRTGRTPAPAGIGAAGPAPAIAKRRRPQER